MNSITSRILAIHASAVASSRGSASKSASDRHSIASSKLLRNFLEVCLFSRPVRLPVRRPAHPARLLCHVFLVCGPF
jgi:hypothetical protein